MSSGDPDLLKLNAEVFLTFTHPFWPGRNSPQLKYQLAPDKTTPAHSTVPVRLAASPLRKSIEVTVAEGARQHEPAGRTGFKLHASEHSGRENW
jgi:hypothetical protein